MKEDDLKERLKQIDKEQLEEIIFKVYKEITLKLDKDYKLQKEEVAEVKYVKIEDIEASKKNNDLNYTFSTWRVSEFEKEMKMLKNKRADIINNKI